MYREIALIIGIILILVILIYLIYTYFTNKNIKPTIKKNNVIIINNPDSKLMKIASKSVQQIIPPVEDVLTEYDRQVTFDPMIEPTRRPPRHQILPILGNPYFNYPTRGFTDSYSMQGYLVRDKKENREPKLNTSINNPEDKKFNKNSDDKNSVEEPTNKLENQIIKLFGREKFPNSNVFEYYVIINTGFNDNIKYFLENQTKELYDGDYIYIDILQSKYSVKLMKNKLFEYNPYLI